MRLDEEHLLNAMGIAYSQMVGDGQAAREGVMTSYIQQGTISKSAIESSFMARAGITGTRNVLQGHLAFIMPLSLIQIWKPLLHIWVKNF